MMGKSQEVHKAGTYFSWAIHLASRFFLAHSRCRCPLSFLFSPFSDPEAVCCRQVPCVSTALPFPPRPSEPAVSLVVGFRRLDSQSLCATKCDECGGPSPRRLLLPIRIHSGPPTLLLAAGRRFLRWIWMALVLLVLLFLGLLPSLPCSLPGRIHPIPPPSNDGTSICRNPYSFSPLKAHGAGGRISSLLPSAACLCVPTTTSSFFPSSISPFPTFDHYGIGIFFGRENKRGHGILFF